MKKYNKDNSLRELMTKKKISVSHLALKCDKPNWLVKSIQSGAIIPTKKLALNIARCINEDVNNIFDMNNYKL